MNADLLHDITPGWYIYRRLLIERFDLTLEGEPTERVVAWEGHEIHVDDWRPRGAGPCRGPLILVHGAGGHGRLLAPIADFVASLGWHVLAPDLPGYGLTRVAPRWRWDYGDWPRCVAALADNAASTRPVVLMGLSVGGMTALGAAQRASGVSGVIATTLLDMADPATFDKAARSPWLGRLSRVIGAVAPRVADPTPLPLRLVAPMGALTSDPKMRRYLVRDRLLGGMRVPGRFFRTLHAWRPARPDLSLPCPLLLVHPGADGWTPTAMSRPVFDRAPGPKRFRELTNGSHLPLERPALDELKAEVADFLADAGGLERA
jgi:pimeloyl-ACP methyl ester carboxylesterase